MKESRLDRDFSRELRDISRGSLVKCVAQPSRDTRPMGSNT